MIPSTPRGFRDCLPTEAAWRQAVDRRVRDSFAAWGYLPIETPTLERLEVLEMAGTLSDTPFRFFDSDNNLLALRPDCTLPAARLTALRLRGKQAPFRLCYSQRVFREQGSLYGEDREFTQMGIEFIGGTGAMADAEVICMLFDALSVAGVRDFTVALGTVKVLNALVAGAGGDELWQAAVRDAFHSSDFVAVDRLSAAEGIRPVYGRAIKELNRIRGGLEAIERCRELVEPLGCDDGLDQLEAVFKLVSSTEEAGTLLVDFSVISSFDYYTGIVFKAYAPGLGQSLGSGGRYDTTLEAFGRKEPAAGFALGLERVMQALEAQGAQPPSVRPDAVVTPLEGETPEQTFARAAQLRREGKRVVIGGER